MEHYRYQLPAAHIGTYALAEGADALPVVVEVMVISQGSCIALDL
jgi:hypothetical protein